MSDSSQLHGLQNTKLPCSLLPPGVCSNSRPLGRWCYLTISSSTAPFSAFSLTFSKPKYRWIFFFTQRKTYYFILILPILNVTFRYYTKYLNSMITLMAKETLLLVFFPTALIRLLLFILMEGKIGKRLKSSKKPSISVSTGLCLNLPFVNKVTKIVKIQTIQLIINSTC